MKTKISKIKWVNGQIYHLFEGRINGTPIFSIDKKGVKKVTYTLQGWSFQNELFPRSNTSKILAKNEDIETLKEVAQIMLEEFVKKYFLTQTINKKKVSGLGWPY